MAALLRAPNIGPGGCVSRRARLFTQEFGQSRFPRLGSNLIFPLLRWRFQQWLGKVLNAEARERVPEAILERVPEAILERVPNAEAIGFREGDR